MEEIKKEIPQLIAVTKGKKCYYTTINYEIEEVDDGYKVSSTTITTDKALCADDYGKIVTALVRARYSADDVEAIQQNYMETKTEAHKKEFSDFKDWRAFVKQKAKEVLEYVSGDSGE